MGDLKDIKSSIVRISMGEGTVEDKIIVSNLDDKLFSELYESMKIEKLDRLYALEDFYNTDEDEEDEEVEKISEKPKSKKIKATPDSRDDKARIYAANRARVTALLISKRK